MRICDLLSRNAVELGYKPADKNDAIDHIVDVMAATGCIGDADSYRRAVHAREAEGSTGMGAGIAIPHAKSDGVLRPGLAAMLVRDGVDFDSVDGEPVKVIFLIASPLQASDAHLDVLARLSTLLIDEKFRADLAAADSVDAFLGVIQQAEEAEFAEQEAEAAKAETEKPSYDIVAVTACPAGLSHTYMAAEALEQKAKELGVTIKVEADGAAGNRNQLRPAEIAAAKAVIVAADRAVEMARFIGKRMVRVGVVDGVRRPAELIKRALDPDCKVYSAGSGTETSSIPGRIYRHLMSGLTYILPLAATAGILSAIARLDLVKSTDFGLFFDAIGYSIGTLLFPVLSAFIAFSMAGRMALVAGFTGGVMADMTSAGVIGAVLNGFVGGAVAFMAARFASRFLKGHDAMFALLVYPLAGALGTTLIAQLVTGLPAAWLDYQIVSFINSSPRWVLLMIGAVLGGMMSADMGGPFNKISYACGVLLLADCLPENGAGSMVMAAVMAGGMIPPLAAALAAGLIGKKRFSLAERRGAPAAALKGLLFVTEGVMPYLKPGMRMRLAGILGSAAGGAAAMALRCGGCAPHGGIFIVPLTENALAYLAALCFGTLIGAVLFTLLRPALSAREIEELRGAGLIRVRTDPDKPAA